MAFSEACRRTVSNTHAQVARLHSCANHEQHIGRLSRATCRGRLGKQTCCYTTHLLHVLGGKQPRSNNKSVQGLFVGWLLA